MFGQLPSERLQPLVPELAWLSPLDWYALDVAAAQRWIDLYAESMGTSDDDDADDGPAERSPLQERQQRQRARPGRSGPVVRERGNELGIRGTETPPWER